MRHIPETFAELCREHSGAHFLDSGGIYGRIYDQPPIPADMPREYARPYSGTDGNGKRYIEPNLEISLAVALDECFELDRRATRAFRLWCEIVNPKGTPDRTWFDLAREYVEKRLARDECGKGADGLMNVNTYNFDNDLDQVVEITSPGQYADWHIIHVHTGADVRGGYAAPVVVSNRGGDGLDDFLCSDRIELGCPHCYESAENLFDADRKGWKPRLNARSVSMVCPKCKRVAARFPIDPIQLTEESSKSA